MTEVPLRIEHGGKWLAIKAGVDKERITVPAPVNQEFLFKSITDLEQRKNILIITDKGGKKIKVASIDKVLEILKRVILASCNGYRLVAYFMSPAIRGGVLVTNAKWDQGSIVVVQTGIWLVTSAMTLCIPLRDLAGIDLTKREVEGKPTDILRIDHVESGEVVSSFVLCPITTLQVLENYLKDATKGINMQGNELDGLDQQVALLVYSGMDSRAIENMLNISPAQLDAIYNKIIGLGIANVTVIRKEVQLTAKGVRYLSDATKT